MQLYLGGKNTYIEVNKRFASNEKFRMHRLNTLYNKYYKMLAWRVPILSNYKYIFYIDASFAVGNKNLYDDAMKAIGNYTFWHVSHPFNKDGIKGEVGQHRYKVDDVEGQIESYLREGFPDSKDQMLISGAYIYHAWDILARRFMKSWWGEVMKHSIQCQVSLPYVFWKEFGNSTNSVRKTLPETPALCDRILFPNGPAQSWHYGRCYYLHGSISPLDVNATLTSNWCKSLQKEFNVQPYKSWGSLPENLQNLWSLQKCDARIFMVPLQLDS